ncbi:hypothetical protein DFQ27_001173 [Actinomortierella ambigua]|uniref:Serine aminopeptidase S33 domain-containing protein n=1 Tax=Actinomortierella ambigua TaxID=1343610 RepID=A0A9P6QD64_9FUNG|nr:hypothetical protein DFQ27_001173 [Actinomortierella ambigua]
MSFFAHWLRLGSPARLATPEAYTLTPFTTRNIKIQTPDNLRLGAWHILPKNTPKAVVQHIQAAASAEYDPAGAVDAIFDKALREADKVVLYFHGQVGDRGKGNRIATYKNVQAALPTTHVVAVDCRGFGDSDGFPSELGFITDALAAWGWVTERVSHQRVMIYGHSLGTGISANLCRKLEEQGVVPLAMILDAAFTSMPDMMTAYRRIPIVRPFARFPLLINHFKQNLLDRFETVRAVESIQAPLLLIHGQEDADVLISNSHTLFHTALTSRRLQTCTRELSVTEAGESKEAEEELARAGLDLGFRDSLTTATNASSSDQPESLLFRGARSSRDPWTEEPEEQAANQGSKDLSRPSSPLSSGNDSGIGSGLTSPGSVIKDEARTKEHAPGDEDSTLSMLDDPHSPRQDLHHCHDDDHHHHHHQQHMGDGHFGSCRTVQLEFPREGSLEYNQQFQIGFLTVQYAIHNNCGEFEITREVLSLFIEAVERRNAWLRDQQMVGWSAAWQEQPQPQQQQQRRSEEGGQEEQAGQEQVEVAKQKGEATMERSEQSRSTRTPPAGRVKPFYFDMVQALRANRVGAEQLDVPEVVE